MSDRGPEDQIVSLLRIHKSTRGLNDEQIRCLASHATVVAYHAGDTVHEASAEADALLLVCSGQLEISVVLLDGSLQRIQYIGRDDEFGLLGIFQSKPFPITVTSVYDTTVIRFEKAEAVSLLSRMPAWSRSLMQSLGPRLREAFLQDKQARVARFVTIIHVAPDSRLLTAWLAERLSNLGETVALISDDRELLNMAQWPSEPLLDSRGLTRPIEELRRVVAQWPDANRIIVDASIKRPSTDLEKLFDLSDAIYGVCRTDTSRRLVDGLQFDSTIKDKLHVIQILQPHERAAPNEPALQRLSHVDFKLHPEDVPGCPTSTRRAGLERIIHHLRGISIGLALGGGAARGMAHLGVLQVFEQAGITIDRMSGTSAGALTGVLHAAGYAADFLTSAFAADLNPKWYYRMVPFGDTWYLLGNFRRRGWESMLRKYLFDWRLEQLPIPFTAVTADLVSANEVRLSCGDATRSILESINMPGASLPICRDGMTLVDGGVLNVVPADVLVEQGATLVVAVDVSARIRFEFAGNRPDTPSKQMNVPNSVQTLVRMRTVQDRNIRALGGSAADLVIEPDVSEVEISDFKRAPAIAELGRMATEESMPSLRKLLNQADPELFPI